MAARGRKPTVHKVLEGDSGNRPLNPNEPVSPKVVTRYPSCLLPKAPARTNRQKRQRKHAGHLRCRKPRRQGSRSQSGKKLPVRIPAGRMYSRPSWHERRRKER